MMDFNDTPTSSREDRATIRAQLLAQLDPVLTTLFPNGRLQGTTFVVGDLDGHPGQSLIIERVGDRAGLWHDFATGQGGDLFDVIAHHHHLDVQRDFPAVLQHARDLLGRTSAITAPQQTRSLSRDDLGPPTAKWDYHDEHGDLIACVTRYDPPRGKQFRPWDARARAHRAPTPRPLYNLPALLHSDRVVLVEGEKCAQALIDLGVCATTAMHGAHAPVEKTNWSPLANKSILIWPDKDKPGWDYAWRAAHAVLAAGATSCAVLLPPDDKPEGWDAADAIADGDDVHALIDRGERTLVSPPVSSATRNEIERCVAGSEDALALDFTQRYHSHWRYVAAWGKWLMWDGRRWRGEETLAASDLIRHVCREAAVQTDPPRVAAKLAAASTVGGVERLARTDRRHAGTTEEWDADIWLLNTPAGVVDLRTAATRAPSREDRLTKITQASAHGECPTWRTFLADVTDHDGALMTYLQRMAGYCLTGATREHAIFFLHGTGANGKSVFVNVLTTILGDYAANAPMDTFMESRTDRHPTDLAGLRGARLVCATETEQGRRWNEAKIKMISGGDPITVRHLYRDFFTYPPHFKIVIAGNHKPAIRNVDEAMKRRLHLIPFTVTIPPDKRDGTLTEKLLQERDGILAWMVEGCLAWQREGLRQPPKVSQATEEYFEEEDAIGEFLEEECQRYSQAREAVADLFERWRARAEKRGEYIGTSRWLVQQLLQRGFERTRLAGGTKALRGLSLKPKDYGEHLPYRDD